MPPRTLLEDRLEIVHPREGVARSTLADDVRRGLGRRPRTLPPKHFYDAEGSRLFDRICELPEYYPTRAERALLERHADAIVRAASEGTQGPVTELVELGSGMARKTGLLLGAIARRTRAPSYVPLDISSSALEQSARAMLAEHETLSVRAIVGDFQHDLARISASTPGAPPRRLFAFLGSTIGNLDETEAPSLVRAIAAEMSSNDAFLLGVDQVKDRSVLHAAYDDAQGVTAAFNRNVLAVINRSLGADFDLPAWDHEARWVEKRSRIEMHLRTRKPVVVNVRALNLRVDFDAGETIHTEISRKFTRETTERTLREGGLRMTHFWDDEGAFALALARRA
jgi:L-histidine N-alpha-methyltransferase